HLMSKQNEVNHNNYKIIMYNNKSLIYFLRKPPKHKSKLFPYTTLFRSDNKEQEVIDTEENELQAEITNLSEKNETLQNKLLRLQAEFDNYKKRTTKEKSAASKYKAEDFAIEMLPIVDNFERAMQTEITEENKGFYDGVEMVYNQLLQVFESQGIAPIKT